jgi:hypothetical protein
MMVALRWGTTIRRQDSNASTNIIRAPRRRQSSSRSVKSWASVKPALPTTRMVPLSTRRICTAAMCSACTTSLATTSRVTDSDAASATLDAARAMAASLR